jgi:hypothetical protein
MERSLCTLVDILIHRVPFPHLQRAFSLAKSLRFFPKYFFVQGLQCRPNRTRSLRWSPAA